MTEDAPGSPPNVESVDASSPSSSPSPSSEQELKKSWQSYISEDLPRTVVESTDSAIRSARSFQLNSSSHLRTLQDFIPQVSVQYKTYEDAFFKKIKDELLSAREHPAVAGGIVVTAALLLMRGPRRFLFRHTLGRLQSEEAQYGRAEKNVKELSLSVDLMKKERVKLLERASFAENEMKDGHAKLMSAGSQIQSLAKTVYKAEAKAADLMDALREIPGREALKLRAEVASMASVLRQERTGASKKIMKISELGVNV
ncbi:hypothetical protein LguiA_012692 [Lonicera macranthoides]